LVVLVVMLVVVLVTVRGHRSPERPDRRTTAAIRGVSPRIPPVPVATAVIFASHACQKHAAA